MTELTGVVAAGLPEDAAEAADRLEALLECEPGVFTRAEASDLRLVMAVVRQVMAEDQQTHSFCPNCGRRPSSLIHGSRCLGQQPEDQDPRRLCANCGCRALSDTHKSLCLSGEPESVSPTRKRLMAAIDASNRGVPTVAMQVLRRSVQHLLALQAAGTTQVDVQAMLSVLDPEQTAP